MNKIPTAMVLNISGKDAHASTVLKYAFSQNNLLKPIASEIVILKMKSDLL